MSLYFNNQSIGNQPANGRDGHHEVGKDGIPSPILVCNPFVVARRPQPIVVAKVVLILLVSVGGAGHGEVSRRPNWRIYLILLLQPVKR